MAATASPVPLTSLIPTPTPSNESDLPKLWFVVQTVYGAVFLVFYSVLIFVLFSVREFNKKSYFAITRIAAVGDVALYVCYALYYRFPANAFTGHWFSGVKPSFGWNVLLFLYFNLKIQRLGFIFLLALNRLTAVLLPLRYQQFWVKYTVHFVILVTAVPVSVTWIYLFTVPSFQLINAQSNTFRMSSGSPPFLVIATLAQKIMILSFVLVSSTINVVCLCCVYLRRILVSSHSVSPTELSLFIISFCEAIVESIEAVILFYLAVLFKQGVDTGDISLYLTITAANSWFFDLTVFSRPLLLVFGSKMVRNAFFRFIALTKTQSIVTIIVS